MCCNALLIFGPLDLLFIKPIAFHLIVDNTWILQSMLAIGIMQMGDSDASHPPIPEECG